MRAFLFSSLFVFLIDSPLRGDTRDIVFWHSMAGARGQLMREIIEDFNHSQKAIAVKPQFIGNYVEGINKLRTAFMGGIAPHIVQIYEIGTQVMLDSQTIEPLETFIEADPSFSKRELYPQILRYYSVAGSLQSLPFATSTPLMYYNKDLFKKAGLTHPPRDLEELIVYAARLTDRQNGVSGITWPLHSWFFEQFVARQGGLLADKSNGRMGRAQSLKFASPEGIHFVSIWRHMLRDGSFANVGRGWAPAEQNFVSGRAAMFFTSSSNMFDIKQKAKFAVGSAPLLPSRKNLKPGGAILGGNSLWLLRGKPKAEQHAAFQFLKYMASAPVQRRWHLGTGYFPIRPDVVATLKAEGFYRANPQAKIALDQLIDAPAMPATRGALLGVFPAVREAIESAIERILTTDIEIKDALTHAEKGANKSLKRYNRLFERLDHKESVSKE